MISGKAKLAGVMGWPVGHSLSPQLHGFWLAHLGIDGAYLPLPVAPENLELVLRTLPLIGFRGVNLTVPHKEKALTVIDSVSERARRIGAVNTIVVGADGSLNGDNTDGFGFLENLKAGAPNWSAQNGPVVIIGAGGAARAVLVALLDDGVTEIRLINRTFSRAVGLASEFGSGVQAVAWERRSEALEGAALLVNSSTLGMTGQPLLDLDLVTLPATAVVNDIVYVPLKTELLAQAQERGNQVVDGLGMLLHQAKPGFAAWFGIEPQVDAALRAYMEMGPIA